MCMRTNIPGTNGSGFSRATFILNVFDAGSTKGATEMIEAEDEPPSGLVTVTETLSGSDEMLKLTPPSIMSLEQSLEFISDDELVEVTPELKELLDAWQPLTPEQRAAILQVAKSYHQK